MDQADGSKQSNPLLTDDVRRYFASLRGGYRTFSKETRSMYGKLNAGLGWAIRRQRYGPSGRRPKGYDQWRVDRGYEAINNSDNVGELNEKALPKHT
jgi:hypothetical protein